MNMREISKIKIYKKTEIEMEIDSNYDSRMKSKAIQR